MFLLELQAQGVKGCSPTLRAPLKPGYVVLKPPSTPPPSLSSLAAAIFYSDGRGGDASFAADGAKGKVGFTILGNDQVTYRLMRELGGAGVLQKLNKATTTFELVSDSASDIGTYLRATVGLPSRSAFEQIFTCTAAQMPSRRPRAVKGGAAALGATPARPSMAHNMPVEPAPDVPAAQARVGELEKELKLSKDIEALQFQQDGLTRQMDELEQKMKGSEGLREALEQAQDDARSAPDTVSVGLEADIVHKAQRYQGAVQRRDEALAKLGTDGSADEPASAPPSSAPVEPLWRNQQFLLGAGLGAVFLVAGALLSGYGRVLALLDIPAFAFAALTAIKHVEDLQGSTRVSKKGSLRAGREKKIHDAFEAEVAPVKAAMKALGVETAEEVVKVLEQKPLLEGKVASLRKELQAWEAEPANRQVAGQYHKLKQQVEAINQKLQAQGGYIREAREVERELQRTKESIQKAQGGVPVGASGPATSQLPSGPGSTSELEDPGPSLMHLAADLFQADVPSLAGLVRDRANQYFSALTDRRYSGLEQDGNGAISALSQGKKLKVGAIPSRDLDLLYLALRLTLVEKYSARSKVPVFLENDLGVEEAKLGLLSRMLKHLGTLTQVVHVTAHPAFPSVADLNGTL
ncbi:MAG TPA: chromosome segregation protein SMC [Myxococcaceae bacterium]|nr:chromosome segregation protein SMC [Myxococcaceae bacterium]